MVQEDEVAEAIRLSLQQTHSTEKQITSQQTITTPTPAPFLPNEDYDEDLAAAIAASLADGSFSFVCNFQLS